MKRSDLKRIIKEEIKKLQKQKSQLNEVYIPCCDEASGAYRGDCCWKAIRDCCEHDKKHGLGASGCCHNKIAMGGTQDMEDMMMMEGKRNLLKESTENCCVRDWNSVCCTDLEKLCCRKKWPCCENDELIGDDMVRDDGSGSGGSGAGMPSRKIRENYYPNPSFQNRMNKGVQKFGCNFLMNRGTIIANQLSSGGKGPKWMIMLRNKIAILRDVAVSNGCGNLPLNV